MHSDREGVDRLPDGTWASCDRGESCIQKFHLPELSVEQATGMPFEVVLPLLNLLDPPQINETGDLYWTDSDGADHRDYDLPAEVKEDGQLAWYQHGMLHRDHDRPALIEKTGRQLWYQHGVRYRLSGKPAILEADGRERSSPKQLVEQRGQVATPSPR